MPLTIFLTWTEYIKFATKFVKPKQKRWRSHRIHIYIWMIAWMISRFEISIWNSHTFGVAVQPRYGCHTNWMIKIQSLYGKTYDFTSCIWNLAWTIIQGNGTITAEIIQIRLLWYKAAIQTDRSKSSYRYFYILLCYTKCTCEGYYSFGEIEVNVFFLFY